MSEARSEFSVLLAVVGLVVGGIIITHDGVTGVLRIGATLVALFTLWLVYRMIAGALVRERSFSCA